MTTLNRVGGVLRAIGRGARRRCPHCGEGLLFRRWLEVRLPCDECGIAVLEDQGDTWAFLVIVDRIFVLLLIGVLYFRFGPPNTWGLAALFGGVTALFIYTTPQRFGGCIGLAYAALRMQRVEDEEAPGSTGASRD